MLEVLELLLTDVGLYGVASYSAVQRRREIGVYLALGASPLQVMHRILREASRCAVAGLAAGLPVCVHRVAGLRRPGGSRLAQGPDAFVARGVRRRALSEFVDTRHRHRRGRHLLAIAVSLGRQIELRIHDHVPGDFHA